MSRDGRLLVAVTAVAAAILIGAGIADGKPVLVALAIVSLALVYFTVD